MSEKVLPRHVGIILDGNRRWAEENGKKTLYGHQRGAEVFKEISLGLFERGIEFVSAYVFSKENWKRKAEEVDYLMRLVVKAVEMHLEDYNKEGIKIKILGNRDGLKPSVEKAIDRTEAKTANNTNGTLLLCFNYTGRQEIVDACKQIVAAGTNPDEITEETISDNIYFPDAPNVDLLIRTSGEQRISGFMLWRASYAEMSFIEPYWPDVTLEIIDKELDNYSERHRRFGC